MRLSTLGKALVAIGVVMILAGIVLGSHCSPVVVRSSYVAPVANYVAPVSYATLNYQPFYAAAFVPTPLYVPTYQVGYAPNYEVQLELKKLQFEIEKLRLQGPAQQQAPRPQEQSQQPAAYPTMPQASSANQGSQVAPGDYQTLLVSALNKCTQCHDDVTKAKGGGFVLFKDGGTRDLSDGEALKVLKEVRAWRMPPVCPTCQKLSGPEREVLTDWVSGKKIAQK